MESDEDEASYSSPTASSDMEDHSRSSPREIESEENDDDDDIYNEQEEEEEFNVKWKEDYCSSHRILLVGEGDFSFSLCLAKAFGFAPNIVATSVDTQQDLVKKYSNGIGNMRELEERGCLVLLGVDAKNMSQHYFLTTQRFDRIVYNFPHVGFLFPEGNPCQIMLNNELVKGFMKNAKVLLKKEKGEIHVTHKLGEPYDKWNLVGEAEKIGLVLLETTPFNKYKYSGYGQKRAHGTKSDDSFHLGACTTFKFRHGSSC